MTRKVSFSSVQLLNCVPFFATPWTTAHQASLSITNPQSLLKLILIESVILSNHLILCRPVLLLLSIFPASGSFPINQFFASGGQSTGASGSASVLSMNIQHQLVQSLCSPWDSQESSPTPQFKRGEWKNWLKTQHSKNEDHFIQRSAFFMVQLSHSYMTTGKTIALTRQTFVGKLMSLLFNMLSRLVIAFVPRSKHLLISRLQSPSAVILEPKKIKSVTVSIVSSSICHEVMGSDAMILVFWMLSFKLALSLSPFTFVKRFFTFCHKGGVICISEVTDTSPGNLDYSLCFIQSSISHDVLCI